jgi:hypothetical protein
MAIHVSYLSMRFLTTFKSLFLSFHQASLDGSAIEISLSTGTAKAVNNIIDQLLAQNYHRMLIDFEDHMDSAAAMSNGKVIGDFRNKFITQAILDSKI